MIDNSWRSLFPEPEIKVALRILYAECVNLSKKSPTEREDDVTDRLVAKIQRNSVYRASNLDLKPQDSIYDRSGAKVGRLGIIDMSFYLLNTPKPVPYFAVEAKRLRFQLPSGKMDTGNSEYVSGDQGMRCFTDMRYSVGLQAGAMLGYVYDGNLSASKSGISALIVKHATSLKLKTPSALQPSGMAGGGADETMHLIDGSLFRMFHMFVAV
ncbi:MAG TPA: hypothetical protein DEA90_13190 [Opitutae bacterium]|nr:hypothetical protein [Puniceicoccaceae bacterium]HBR95109.1 hypothetical protein [Opitutae bacterium]|tara:strand:- start:508 stop:1143 length:636 start_codon:yes stop_codon:yes gene_type:complete